MADPVLWERLNAFHGKESVERAGIRLLADGVYGLEVLNAEYRIDATRRTIMRSVKGRENKADDLGATAILNYVLESKDIEIAGEWVSPLELPHGAQFFRGPHGLPVHGIAARFGNTEQDFRAASRKIGGTPLEFADAAYAFDVFQRIPVAVLLWLKDDEFPARVSLLVDRTAHLQLRLDALLGVFYILEEFLLQTAAERLYLGDRFTL